MRKIDIVLLILIAIALFFNSCKKEESPEKNEKDPQKNGEKVFFSDNFESGDMQKPGNGFEWTDNTVELGMTPNGSIGLKFVFGPDDTYDDSWREQRFKFGHNYSDIWIKYDLYVPDNYHHRRPIKYTLEKAEASMNVGDTVIKVDEAGNIQKAEDWGIIYDISGDSIWVDQLPSSYTLKENDYIKNKKTSIVSFINKRKGYGDNNKFILVWQGDYGSTSTGNSIDLEYWSKDRGSSCLSHYLSVDQGAKLRNEGHTHFDKLIIDKNGDLGKWMELIFHFKIATEADNDGIIHIIKNGEDYLNSRNIGNYSEKGNNYFEKGYLLGWSNSGFKEETVFYIDNVVFSTDSIVPN